MWRVRGHRRRRARGRWTESAGGVSPEKLEEYAASKGDSAAAQTRRLYAIRHRQWLSYNERRLQMSMPAKSSGMETRVEAKAKKA